MQEGLRAAAPADQLRGAVAVGQPCSSRPLFSRGTPSLSGRQCGSWRVNTAPSSRGRGYAPADTSSSIKPAVTVLFLRRAQRHPRDSSSVYLGARQLYHRHNYSCNAGNQDDCLCRACGGRRPWESNSHLRRQCQTPSLQSSVSTPKSCITMRHCIICADCIVSGSKVGKRRAGLAVVVLR